jgi:hypothetical protein
MAQKLIPVVPVNLQLHRRVRITKMQSGVVA